jgi:TPR repeat protein
LSQFYLGLAYISGEDININKREGMKRMKRAAKNGDSKAIEYLESHHE